MRAIKAVAPRALFGSLAICGGVATILVAVGILSLTVGAVRLSIPEVIDGLTGGKSAFIVTQYRAPRIFTSILAGAALAVAGVFLQGAIRNPLASPDVVGITKGAGLGAMVTVIFIPANWLIWAIPAGVMIGATLASVILLALGRRLGGGAAMLALIGISVAAMGQAAMQFLMVRFPSGADQSMVWLAGSVYGATQDEVWMLGSWLLICLPFVVVVTSLQGLAGFGDDSLISLGIHPLVLRACLIIVSVALAAGAVASVGSMGFIGLIAPHVARILVGPRARDLVPAAALVGALGLCIADLIGRILVQPNEIPAGIVASIIGGPYLLFLLVWETRKHE
jgi:ABC-type Fe3+-siderophore transport system permease subunit